MKKHAFVIFLVGVYVFTQTCVEFGKAFADQGAAKLHSYTWADWLVLLTGTSGSVGLTVMAFFSRAFATHMAKLESNGKTDFWPKVEGGKDAAKPGGASA